MWNKIFLIILAIAVLAMCILLYLPYGWVQSITAPADVAANYKFYSNISWIFLLISSLVLLILGNVLLWMSRRAWAMWVSLLYFAVFIVAHTFWLEGAFFRYSQDNLKNGVIFLSPVFGVVLIFLAAVIVFFDQYLVKRMQDKMYPTAPIDALPEESLTEDKNL